MDKIKCTSFNSRTTLFTKKIVVLTLGFSIRLFFSCTPPPPIDIHFNSIKIIGVNNSDRFINSNTGVDTMYSSAVAFKLTLLDSTYNYYAFNLHKTLKALSFTPAMALSFVESFIPVNKVEQIKVTTLFDIDDNIKAGEDITKLILFERGNNFELYQNINSAISTLNKTQPTASSSIVFVLSVSTKKTTLQLNVQITLDNGTVLSTNTDVITIINPT